LDRSHARANFHNQAFIVRQERSRQIQNGRPGAVDWSRQKAVPEFRLFEPSPEERNRRWKSFGVSSVLQPLGLVLLLWLAAALPSVEPKHQENVWTAKVTLLTPVLAKPVQQPMALPAIKTPPPAPRPKLAVETPKIVEPKPVAPPVVVARAHLPIPEPPKLQPVSPRTEVARPDLPKWEPKVQVGAFKDTAPAVAKLNVPAAHVQTGGFGSPNGLPGLAQGGSHGNVTHVGAFDLPAGPGSGSGSGGAHGTQGRVASAGFGDAAAAAPSQGVPGGRQVAAAGFADAQSLTQGAPLAQPRQSPASFDPVEIVSKPNPVYTEEARRLHIQGEVLLRVVFGASGRLQILGVARGLGHGLDQAAIQAAQQIEFKPARRNGQPVDTTATLHILFELAA
jgi:TonB family protein